MENKLIQTVESMYQKHGKGTYVYTARHGISFTSKYTALASVIAVYMLLLWIYTITIFSVVCFFNEKLKEIFRDE